jgi:SAM-dependent methyltransferase
MRPASVTVLIKRLRHGGLRWLAGAFRDRVFPARPAFFEDARHALAHRSALEIGGPSRLFRPNGGLPAYAWLETLDNINFAAGTAWEHNLREGGEFRFHPAKPPGRQFLREAVDLSGIADSTYDAILSSHCLEHVANPLATLREWLRVTRPGGHLLIVLPDPARTFDHRRQITSLDHLVSDFQAHRAEDDLTHLDEVLAFHDLALDPAAGTVAEFAARARANPSNRCLHHHVFDLGLLRTALAEAGWQVTASEKLAPIHLAAFARKPGSP